MSRTLHNYIHPNNSKVFVMTDSTQSRLLSPMTLRGVTLRNRIVVAPMCTYSAQDGVASDFHLVHLGRFALGGAGLVMVEATAVQPEGRISHGDLGLWNDDQIAGQQRIAHFLREQGAVPGIQLGHAGRKASMQRPWHGNGPLQAEDIARGDEPWPIRSSTGEPFDDGWLVPRMMTTEEIGQLKQDFVRAAERALAAGFEVLELHCAHGYLLNAFLSPVVNQRCDEYGGDRDGRMRLPLELASLLRDVWPQDKPLFVRISSVDGVEGGWDIDDSIAFARELKARGVDIVDCSSGGVATSPTASTVPRGYGFQVPFAERIRREAGIATMAVGLIVDPRQAQQILENGEADLIAVAREMLANPNWALDAELALRPGQAEREQYAAWPPQYGWWLERRARGLARMGPWRE